MKPVALQGAARDFALACLFLKSTSERFATLRRAAERVHDWDGIVATLERHGVAVLARRNVERAEARLPAPVRAAWDERVEALGEDARRFRLTLERFVAACAERGVVPTLLKGASLGLDLYPDPAVRGQGDIDVLVTVQELRRAVRAGAAAGLVRGEESFPIWWYRLAHFHLKLRPTAPLLREVEVHWALQHPSLLVGPDPRDLRARVIAAEVGDHPVRTLEPLDRLHHLVTHLLSHAHGAPGPPTRATLEAILEEPAHPLRLKWVLDVHAEVERLAGELPACAVAAHARTWGAEAQVAWALMWVRAALGLVPTADGWVDEILGDMGEIAPLEVVGVRRQERGPVAGLDFRLTALRRLGGWIAPSTRELHRRYGRTGLRVRTSHAVRVLVRVGFAVVLLPAAFLGRALFRPWRRHALRRARAPEELVDLAVAWRSLERKPRDLSRTKRR